MRATATALCVGLLVGGGVLISTDTEAALTQDSAGDRTATISMPAGTVELAGSFHNSPAKLNDKYLAGKSGGWYGIGGPESKIFKKKKLVPCCNNSKP